MLIKYQMRNNFFGKTSRQIDSIINSKKIICPWNHFKKFYDLLDRDYKFSKIFINEFKINDLVLVQESGNENILIVKILSELKKEINPYLKIIRHKKILPIQPNENDVIKVININFEFKEITPYLNESFSIENFYCYYRDIEIIAIINKRTVKNLPELRNSIGKYNINIEF